MLVVLQEMSVGSSWTACSPLSPVPGFGPVSGTGQRTNSSSTAQRWRGLGSCWGGGGGGGGGACSAAQHDFAGDKHVLQLLAAVQLKQALVKGTQSGLPADQETCGR